MHNGPVDTFVVMNRDITKTHGFFEIARLLPGPCPPPFCQQSARQGELHTIPVMKFHISTRCNKGRLRNVLPVKTVNLSIRLS